MEQPIITDPTIETWKPVVGWEGLYSVSDRGRVRSEDRTVHYSSGRIRTVRGKIRALGSHRFGYPMVTMKSAGRKQRTEYVHRLVLEAFVGPCPEGMEVCHNNGDPTCNLLSNLRWDTHSENTRDKRRHGTDHEVNKTHCKRGNHPLKGANLSPWKLRTGQRECLACARTRSRVNHYPELRPLFQEISDSYYAAIVQNNPL